MGPMRGMGGGMGGRGGMPGMSSAAARLAIAVIAASVVTFALNLQNWVMLVPGLVFQSFAVWQPITYALIGGSPMEVLFSALIIWQMGGFFETTWGSRRTLFFGLGLTVIAGLVTVLLALLIPGLRGFSFGGAGVIASVLWVGYGLSFGKSHVPFWGASISGYAFAGIGCLFVVLQAAFGSLVSVIPEVLALGMAAAWVRLGSPKVWWLRLQSWRLNRELRGRSKHLRVVDTKTNSAREDDGWLN